MFKVLINMTNGKYKYFLEYDKDSCINYLRITENNILILSIPLMDICLMIQAYKGE